MIHYWECDRCTHQWQSSCFGDMGTTKEEKERRSRQLSSGLCWDCFEQLESGEIAGLELFELYYYLNRKCDKYGASKVWRVFNEGTAEAPFYNHQKFSGMCHDFISPTFNEDGSYKTRSNFEGGETAEHKQLRNIVSNMEEVFQEVIKKQRTVKRIELDEFQKTAGLNWFGPQDRPENFVGDPPGKQRFETLFGLDMTSGNIIAPTIRMNDGTK
jgi:hypothetical protein